jgi:hypothetical protein
MGCVVQSNTVFTVAANPGKTGRISSSKQDKKIVSTFCSTARTHLRFSLQLPARWAVTVAASGCLAACAGRTPCILYLLGRLLAPAARGP